jgi:hypothetical protein
MANESDVRALVDRFTDQLQLLARRLALQEVLGALGGSPPARRGRPARSAGATRGTGRRGGKRTAAELERMRGRLLVHVRANPGQRADQIAAALGTDVGTMRLPMRSLIAEKKVGTQGQRRGTTYYPGGVRAKSAEPHAQSGRKERRGRRRKTGRG